MNRKAFIQLTLTLLLVSACFFLIASAKTKHIKSTEECSEVQKEECDNNRTQGEFIFWESIERTILSNSR